MSVKNLLKHGLDLKKTLDSLKSQVRRLSVNGIELQHNLPVQNTRSGVLHSMEKVESFKARMHSNNLTPMDSADFNDERSPSDELEAKKENFRKVLNGLRTRRD